MNKIFIKVFSAITVLVVLLSIAVGCSLGEAKINDKVNKEKTETDQSSNKNDDPPIELKISVFDRDALSYIADNNIQTKWIQEKFGDPNNIKVTFVPIPRWEEVEHLNVLMAANIAPDICITYNGETVVNFAKNGSLFDLGELIDKNAPKLKEYLGEELLAYGRWDNTQFAIPAKRVMQAAISTFIRKDWLDTLNMPVPQTSEEFYDTLKAFKERDPGNLGDKTVPFIFNIDPDNITWSVHTLLNGFVQEVSDEDRNILPSWVLPGYKEGMRYLNRLYNEGLTSKLATDVDGKIGSKDIIEGRVGSFITGYDMPYRSSGGMALELKKSVPEAEVIPIDPFPDFEGKHNKMLYNPNGLYIIIPKSSERAVEAMKYLEWMTDPDVLFYLQNGEKGVHYTEEKNGIPTKVVPMDQVPEDKKANFMDLSIIVNGNEFGSQELNMEAASHAYPGYEELYKQSFKIAMDDGIYVPLLNKNTEASAKYNKILQEKDIEIFVKSISCKPADFDKTYDSLTKDYLELGGQEIIEEKRAIYNGLKQK